MKVTTGLLEITEIAHLTDPKFGLYSVLEQVVSAISEEIFLCDSVGIFLSQSNETFRGYVGIPDNINGIQINQIVINPNNDLFYKQILETKKFIYIPDTSKDNRLDARTIEQLEIKSLLGLPICYEKEIFGLVSVFKNGCTMNLTGKEIKAVESYIKIAAIAIHNAKLLSQEQELLLKNQQMLSATLEEWEKAQESFFKVFKLNPVAMSIVSNKDTYVDVNQSWLELFGGEKEKVIGSNVRDSVNLKCNKISWKQYKEFKNQEFRNKEVVLTTRTGDRRNILLTSENIEFCGERCMLNVFNDVTLLRKFEKEVSRYDGLNLVAQMAAGIAHEIRNPMTTVRGFLQLIKNKEGQESNVQYYDLMIEELDRANGIISEFLSLAREKDYDFAKKDLNDILDAIFPLLMADAFTNNVMIELKKGDIPKLELDEKQIRQLVYNLVRNGVEAMLTSGKVIINTIDTDDEVLLTIEDYGIGIPAKLSSKIGAPFFTTKDNGTGLGLSVCHSIARRHNAVIDFESKEDGTKVLVRFKKA